MGGHSLSLSVLAVLLMEFACIFIVAIAVRSITGRTLVQLLTRKRTR